MLGQCLNHRVERAALDGYGDAGVRVSGHQDIPETPLLTFLSS